MQPKNRTRTRKRNTDRKQASWYQESTRNDLRAILSQERERSSRFSKRIAFAYPVYYPIATITAKVQERSIADFPVMEQNVLKFIDELGTADPALIASVSGMSEAYAAMEIKTIIGDGFLKDAELTETGRASLRDNVRYLPKTVYQKFQLDAFNLRLIRLDDRVTVVPMGGKRTKLSFKLPILHHWEGVSRAAIDAQLKEMGYERFIQQEEGVHTNALQVDDIRCDGIGLATCYLIKLHDLDVPVVYALRKHRDDTTHRTSSRWEPFVVPQGLFADRQEKDWFDDEESGTYRAAMKTYIDLICDRRRHDIEKRVKENRQLDPHLPVARADVLAQVHRDVQKVTEKMHLFPKDKVAWAFDDVDRDINAAAAVRVTLSNFRLAPRAKGANAYLGNLLNVLQGIALDGGFVYSGDLLHGAICRISTQDGDLRELAAMLTERIQSYGYQQMRDYLMNLLPHLHAPEDAAPQDAAAKEPPAAEDESDGAPAQEEEDAALLLPPVEPRAILAHWEAVLAEDRIRRVLLKLRSLS